jgi:hypothetical protein
VEVTLIMQDVSKGALETLIMQDVSKAPFDAGLST